MSNHTPGPWTSKGTLILRDTTGTNDTPIANVYLDFKSGEEAAANARLLSASPQLLEALKGLRDVVHDYLTHEQQLAVKAYIHAADAAIAKAAYHPISKT